MIYSCVGTASWAAPTVFDNSGSATVTVSPTVTTDGGQASAVFAIGSTDVTYTARDAAGNTGSCTVLVAVQDNEAPKITCPGNVAVSTSVATQTASWSPATATDNADTSVALSYSKTSGSSFAVGSTSTVSCGMCFMITILH